MQYYSKNESRNWFSIETVENRPFHSTRVERGTGNAHVPRFCARPTTGKREDWGQVSFHISHKTQRCNVECNNGKTFKKQCR